MKGLNQHTTGIVHAEVTEEMTARRVESGSLQVLATPVLIALMEKAACQTLDYFLEDGETTVGTAVNIDHLAPSGIGAKIKVEAEVIFFTKREIVFRVTACDEESCNRIGSGTHTRVVVNAQKFQKKAEDMVEAAHAIAATRD